MASIAITAGWLIAAAAPAPLPARELILDAETGYEIEAEVNGTSLRLRVDPGATGVIVLNPSAADRASLKPRPLDAALAGALGVEHMPKTGADSMLVSGTEVPVNPAAPSRIGAQVARPAAATAQLGPIGVRGKLGSARTVIAGHGSEKVFSWFDRDVVTGADGLISPAGLPFEKVTFRMRNAPEAGKPIAFPVRFRPLEGLSYRHPLSRQELAVKFSVLAPATTGTAAASALMARRFGGQWAGERRDEGIGLGVVRAVRPMTFAAPPRFKALQLNGLLVRVADHRGGYVLPLDHVVSETDLLVTARSPQAAQFTLVIGQDAMTGCSRISYIRPDRIELVCR